MLVRISLCTINSLFIFYDCIYFLKLIMIKEKIPSRIKESFHLFGYIFFRSIAFVFYNKEYVPIDTFRLC